MVNRVGSSSFGCLTWGLIIGAVAFVGTHVADPYYRYYRYNDAISQQVRFAQVRPDSAIMRDIYAMADTLNMPEEAYHLHLLRAPDAVRVSGSYDDEWSLFTYHRDVLFTVDVQSGH